MSTGPTHCVLIPLWQGQGLYGQLLFHPWERTGTGLAARALGRSLGQASVGFSQWACMHGLTANGLTHAWPPNYNQHLTPCSVSTVHGAGLQRSHLSFILVLWHLCSLYFLFKSWWLPPLGAAPCIWDSSCWEELCCHWIAPLDWCPCQPFRNPWHLDSTCWILGLRVRSLPEPSTYCPFSHDLGLSNALPRTSYFSWLGIFSPSPFPPP